MLRTPSSSRRTGFRIVLNLVCLLLIAAAQSASAASRSEVDAWRNADPDATWYLPSIGGVQQILEWFQAVHPERVQVVQIGQSVRGRPIVAARITDGVRDEASWARPTFVLTGGHHGNETPPPRVILDYLDDLLDPARAGEPAYPGASITLGQLLATRQLWVVPVVSPDGYDSIDRKNAAGVDLNRDYEGQWKHQPDPSVKSTTGPYPLSQPESWAVDNLLANVLPAVYLDVHIQKQPMWQTGTSFSPAEFFAWTEEDRTCICDSSGSIICDVFDETTGSVDIGVTTGSQVDPPTPVPATPRFAAKSGSNWDLVVNRTSYTWSDSASQYFNNTTRTPGNDVLHFLERRTFDSPEPPQSLPGLSEWRARNDAVRRYYAPYSPFDACETRPVRNRGTGGLQQQVYNHARQKFGAQALLLELPRFKVTDVFTDAERWTRVPGTNSANDRGKQNRWWDVIDSEALVADINKDLTAPFNRLLELAANPVPEPASGSYADLAIVGLQATDGECVTSTVYPAVYDARQAGRSVGAATYGSQRLSCRVANFGNTVASFSVTLTVRDETTGSAEQWTGSFAGVAAGATRSFERSHDFAAGRRYQVSCALSGATESDAAEITVVDDQGCAAACGAGDCPPECSPTAPGTYDRVWRTNNTQRIRFDAILAPESLCGDGVARPRNVNGYPVGHIPAIASP